MEKLKKTLGLKVVVIPTEELIEKAVDYLCDLRKGLDDAGAKEYQHKMLASIYNVDIVSVMRNNEDIFIPFFETYLADHGADMVCIIDEGVMRPLWTYDDTEMMELNLTPVYTFKDKPINFNWINSRTGQTIRQNILDGNKVGTIITIRNNIEGAGLYESKVWVEEKWDGLVRYCKTL